MRASPRRTWRTRLSDATDTLLGEVHAHALASTGVDPTSIAVVALGGYGRRIVAPGSDLDIAVVHDGRADPAARLAEALWYPIWDTGVTVGHSVRSIDEVAALVTDEVESATALLDARQVAGDAAVATALVERIRNAWQDGIDSALGWLHGDIAARRERFGEVAYATEPDLKNGGGGLRDVHVARWIDLGRPVLTSSDADALDEAARVLDDVRVTLHRVAGSSGDVLRLEDQDPIARRLAESDADLLMTRIAQAARTVAWILDEAVAAAITGAPKRARRRLAVPVPAVEVPDGFDPADPAAVLELAAEAAAGDGRIARDLLERVAAEMPAPAVPWSSRLRGAFVALLASGPGMVDVVESLDNRGIWERFVPEWPAVHARAQRSPHHRFTVDRHLLETVANAAALADRVERPELLVTGALLHDLGKGHGGDHTEIGTTIARRAATRMGFDAADTDVLAGLVEHHLLLSEVATRRDLTDPATIDAVARAVQTSQTLALLGALSEADGLATGPSSWTEWKSGLVHQLTALTAARLSGERLTDLAPTFPSVEQLQLLRAGVTSVHGEANVLTVAAPDQPGLFCRVTGAVTLSGLNVIGAGATSSGGFALEEFRVVPAFASRQLAQEARIDWPKVVATVERAMSGRLAVAARVADRASTYRRNAQAVDTAVRISFDDTSDEVTVVEVEAPDSVGLLYRLTRALSEMDVDVRAARVETLTDRVVDVFSLTDATGTLITDEVFRAELDRALRDAVSP